MEIRLDGRAALVTGGSRGLGRAMAGRLAASGASVAIVARRPAELAEAVEAIRAGAAPGAQVVGCVADVSTAEGVARCHAEATGALGGIDILVNNAGTSTRGPFEAIGDAEWEADAALKLHAAARLARLVLPHMKAQRWGRIINVVSIAGKTPGAGGAPTAVHRAAGIAMTKVLAAEFAPFGVLVNALCPGFVLTDQWARNHRRDAPGLSFEDYLSSRARGIPLGRLGRPEEFAAAACFLASDQASFITGVALNVDGGQSPVT